MPDDPNPYAPPTAAIGDEPVELYPVGDLAAAEAVRRAHIGHEAAVKSIGSLHYLGAFFGFLAVVPIVIEGLSQAGAANPERIGYVVGAALVYVVVSSLQLALGIGLRKLQTWARWTDVALISLSLILLVIATAGMAVMGIYPVVIGYLIGSLIPGYMLYLLVSSKAATIFSPEYKAIIAQTPHIKYRTSLVLKIVLAILVAVIAVAIVAALVGSSR
jgi:uncharacterized membrane protein (DUF2068 family)